MWCIRCLMIASSVESVHIRNILVRFVAVHLDWFVTCSLGNILPCCTHLLCLYLRFVCFLFFNVISLSSKFIYILKLRKWTCLNKHCQCYKMWPHWTAATAVACDVFLLFFKAVHTRFYREILKVQIQALKPDSVMLLEFMRFSSLLLFLFVFLFAFYSVFFLFFRSSTVAHKCWLWYFLLNTSCQRDKKEKYEKQLCK